MPQPNRRQAIKVATASIAGASAAGAGKKALADLSAIRSLPVITGRAVSYQSEHKKRAIADYVANMKPLGGSLSRHGRHLLDPRTHQSASRTDGRFDFDILIIGSGYGASICAARLSMAKHPTTRLAVIERGREWIPGTFGDTFRKTSAESRFQMLGPNKNSVDNPVGLINAMQNDEVNVLSGNGLGGSSLINASVAIRPEAACFDQTHWPTVLRDPATLDSYYNRAAWELGAEYEATDASPKATSQRLAAKNLACQGARCEPATLAITRGARGESVLNRQGLRQRACIDCGDCCAGCNVGAKNTLAMNYLPMAKRHGAEIYTHTEVERVEKLAEGGYRVHFKNYLPQKGLLGRDHGFKTVCGSVTSRVVIVGAGSIGSNEILLRSRGCGMELSERVGQRWTMNGDALGFVRKSKYLTNIAGYSAYDQQGCSGNPCPVGPTIQTNLTFPNRPRLADRVLIQDGSVSRAYANILGGLMRDMDFDQTLVMLGMGHDGSDGRIVLREDGLGSVKWPGIKDSPYRKLIRSEFKKVAEAHGGQYKYLKLFGDNFITVHPLGGCAMSDDPTQGVVDDCGRVFDAQVVESFQHRNGRVQWAAHVHAGLYVADGSVIPTSIGCNPLLTISALSERIADGIVSEPNLADLFR
ncbi:Cholesterol oxidase precursor [Rubripirellula amarantea]|uniref:Cholesterol oxidase n=1 Tax=Rubripirellula amarantea TaxID=2527999 RepID=A0A5C5WRS9_9BACT|nr:GMC family oxidoreductase N-terminal domain-containing protein [Rubripirellula amarantea]TWT53247.1 Cholesterol oxidase precursor [Rubripirellula amarantea]